MFQLTWTGPALGDRSIDSWLEREARPEVALSMLATIRRRARSLEEFPHGGRPHGDGTRILRVYKTPYIIRYRLLSDTGTIQILRVYHEREDWFVEP